MTLAHQWVSQQANQVLLSNFGFTPNDLARTTGPTFAHCTLSRTLFDFHCYVEVGSASPPPERWIDWVELMVVLHHDAGVVGTRPPPFSDDPRIIGTFLLQKTFRLSPTAVGEYTVGYHLPAEQDIRAQRVGSGIAFDPPHVSATLHMYDPGFDMDGVFAYSTSVNWFGSLRTLWSHGP